MTDIRFRMYIIVLFAGCLLFASPHEAYANRFGFSRLSLVFWQNQNGFTLQKHLVQRMRFNKAAHNKNKQ